MLGGDTSSSSGAKPPCLPMIRSGVGGEWGMEDAWPDVATKVACVDVPQRCLLMSFPLPSCTPCGGTRGHDQFIKGFSAFWGESCLILELCVCVCVGFIGVFFWGGWSFFT